MKRDEERENREERDAHSVKVTQCKRKPCRAISKPPHEAENLLSAGRVPDDERPTRPPRTTKDPGCSPHQASREITDLLSPSDA